MTSTAASTDIVPGTPDVALGSGWYPLETYRGLSFRWVQNDAVVNVAALEAVQHALRLVVEPGPGVDLKAFELTVNLADGTPLGSATVVSKQVVKFELPPDRPRVFTVLLHAKGGGKPNASDPRILNFRIFEIAVDRTADVFPAWAKPGKGFYSLETQGGQAFRWVSNDGAIALHKVRDAELVFDVESGPGHDSKPFALRVKRPDGKEVVMAQIATRTRVRVPLSGLDDVDALTLHADGGGTMVKGEPRTLNFRVFSAV